MSPALSPRGAAREPLRVSIDTGGTFTDCVWIDNGRLQMRKVFSTPDDPSRAIVEALSALDIRGRELLLLHGTTVGTNTLLTRRGARTALVTTEGFEDIIEIGRQARPKLYDLFFDRPEPLVPAERRFGVAERMSPDGVPVRKLAPADLPRLRRSIAASKPEAIAVCLLFSFANPAHERLVARALTSLGVPLSLSHIVLPEFREYERASTVVVNAYLQPVVDGYLRKLEDRVTSWMEGAKGKGARVFVMQSSGGITSVTSAGREPVRTVLSGPAGGVVGAAAIVRGGRHDQRFQRIISFDMGGTSTDVCLVDRLPGTTNEADIAGLPVRVPMLAIHTVGAGGGSLARFDAAGALHVGPESAGADPGPICYGRGETPTVSDANLLLGRIRADNFLGGGFKLDLNRTRRLTGEWLMRNRSKLTVEQFAAGVVRVVNANMEKAIRVVSVERGYDPRDFTLVAFGGAGGLHACELASALSIPRVIVPVLPGALSAYGILASDVVKDYSRTVVLTASAGHVPEAQLRREFGLLEKNARAEFARERWEGKPVIERSVDVRYRGQGYELNVSWSGRLLDDFHAEHKRRYGHSHPQREVELVTLRLRARLPVEKPRLTLAEAAVKPAAAVRARVYFNRWIPTSLPERSSLVKGRTYRGPAVVTEYSATTFVPPGMRFRLDGPGNLLIEIARRK
jgi:N-methylhydantoinase A